METSVVIRVLSVMTLVTALVDSYSVVTEEIGDTLHFSSSWSTVVYYRILAKFLLK
jgi:hypothetical protein